MNRIRDEIRKRQGRANRAPFDSQVPDSDPSPLEQAIGRQAVERYETALGRLREEDRGMLIGRLELGLTWDELAEATGKPSADATRKASQRAPVKLVVVYTATMMLRSAVAEKRRAKLPGAETEAEPA